MDGPVNPDNRPLPPGWNQHYDTQRQTWYYICINVNPPQVTTVHPLGLPPPPLLVPPNDSDDRLSQADQRNTTQSQAQCQPQPLSDLQPKRSGMSFAQKLYASSLPVGESGTSPLGPPTLGVGAVTPPTPLSMSPHSSIPLSIGGPAIQGDGSSAYQYLDHLPGRHTRSLTESRDTLPDQLPPIRNFTRHDQHDPSRSQTYRPTSTNHTHPPLYTNHHRASTLPAIDQTSRSLTTALRQSTNLTTVAALPPKPIVQGSDVNSYPSPPPSHPTPVLPSLAIMPTPQITAPNHLQKPLPSLPPPLSVVPVIGPQPVMNLQPQQSQVRPVAYVPPITTNLPSAIPSQQALAMQMGQQGKPQVPTTGYAPLSASAMSPQQVLAMQMAQQGKPQISATAFASPVATAAPSMSPLQASAILMGQQGQPYMSPPTSPINTAPNASPNKALETGKNFGKFALKVAGGALAASMGIPPKVVGLGGAGGAVGGAIATGNTSSLVGAVAGGIANSLQGKPQVPAAPNPNLLLQQQQMLANAQALAALQNHNNMNGSNGMANPQAALLQVQLAALKQQQQAMQQQQQQHIQAQVQQQIIQQQLQQLQQQQQQQAMGQPFDMSQLLQSLGGGTGGGGGGGLDMSSLLGGGQPGGVGTGFDFNASFNLDTSGMDFSGSLSTDSNY